MVLWLCHSTKVDSIFLVLYNKNMQICKEKSLNDYQKIDPSGFWYINTMEY